MEEVHIEQSPTSEADVVPAVVEELYRKYWLCRFILIDWNSTSE